MLRWLLALWIGVLMSIPFTANADEEPAILLANVYRNQVDVTQYLVRPEYKEHLPIVIQFV